MNLKITRSVLSIALALVASIAAFSQTPVFGPLGNGGMPKCLHEINPGVYVPGELVLSNTAYTVWVARKRVGQEYRKVTAWKEFGPFKLDGGKRYVFTGDSVSANLRPGSTSVSPGLASLHFENRETWPVWIVVNPLPPGCGKSATEGSSNDISGKWNDLTDVRGSLTITQRGNSISGTYDHGEAKGTITGTLAGQTIRGSWVNNLKLSGTFEFVLSPDGRRFNGFYLYNGQKSGWSGSRVNDTPASPEAKPPTAALSGTWTAYIPSRNWSHGGYQIIQNGQDLTYIVWSGERYNGRVLSERTISYLPGNETGTVSADGMRIDWSNGVIG
jgi:hypothetical protein